MAVISKRAYEDFFQNHNFRRTDGKGWLGVSETLVSATVTVLDDDGTDVTTSISPSSDVSVFENTKVRYRLMGGTDGETYQILIKVVSSTGQKFEDIIDLVVNG